MRKIKKEALLAEGAKSFPSPNAFFSEIDLITSIQEVLVSEELFYRLIEDWMSFTRKEFDCHVNGEPYQAVNFLLNLKSGEFLIRVWCRTVRTGFLFDPHSVSDKIQETFQGQLPCTGLLHEDQEPVGKVSFTDFPFSRMISSTCSFFKRVKTGEEESEELLCKSCTKIDSHNLNEENALDCDNGPMADFLEVKQDLDYADSLKEENYGDDFAVNSNSGSEDSAEQSNDRPKPPVSSDPEKDALGNKQCSKCLQVFKSKSALLSHNHLDHLFGSYICSFSPCQFKGYYAEDYVQHLTEEHACESNSLTCQVCKEDVKLAEFCPHLR